MYVMVQIVEDSLIIVHNMRAHGTELESTHEIILHNCIVKVHKSDVHVFMYMRYLTCRLNNCSNSLIMLMLKILSIRQIKMESFHIKLDPHSII